MRLAFITVALSLTGTNKAFFRNENHGGRKGDEAEEGATAAVVMVRTFNFDRLEAWPEASGGLSLDRDTECDGKLTNNNTHTFTLIDLPHIKRKESVPIFATAHLWPC